MVMPIPMVMLVVIIMVVMVSVLVGFVSAGLSAHDSQNKEGKEGS
jgi:flagellar basal body-associated protein FliL